MLSAEAEERRIKSKAEIVNAVANHAYYFTKREEKIH